MEILARVLCTPPPPASKIPFCRYRATASVGTLGRVCTVVIGNHSKSPVVPLYSRAADSVCVRQPPGELGFMQEERRKRKKRKLPMGKIHLRGERR
jgi:hypothetical protein